jgi:hypothetical protein
MLLLFKRAMDLGSSLVDKLREGCVDQATRLQDVISIQTNGPEVVYVSLCQDQSLSYPLNYRWNYYDYYPLNVNDLRYSYRWYYQECPLILTISISAPFHGLLFWLQFFVCSSTQWNFEEC